MTKPVLQVIIGSTRPGRAGAPIATWFYDLAVADGRFDVELVDLAEVNLPIFNEPNHPIQGKYEFDHTKRWSATVSRGDAFVFVVPEYNHSFNAATKNALDYLHNEWRYKPVGIVSYGGAVMGTRSAQHLKPVFTALKLVHAGDVSIPLVTLPVVDGVFTGNDVVAKAAQNLLNELDFITPGLMQLRAGR